MDLQVLRGDGSWKTTAVAATDSKGKVSYRQSAGKATWRAVLHPASTVWEQTTATRTL